jgi:hypothetical protein
MVRLAAKSISETQRVRYLLGLCSPAEGEHIESQYFEDDEAFQEMLTVEDDLIDAYARGELVGEERRRFEKNFVRASRGRARVQFARAFAGAVSASPSVETNLLKIFFQPSRLLRTATIAAVIVFVAVFAWLVIDRRRMTNEFRELRAQSAELSKRAEALQRNSDAERTRNAELTAQLTALQPHLDKPRHVPEVKNDREKIASSKPERVERAINIQEAKLGNAFEPRTITQLPLDVRSVPDLLSLQPAIPRGGRADQTNITLDVVDVNEALKTDSLKPGIASSKGGSTVRGTAKDPNGNVVSGATVTLTNSARNFTRTQSTTKDGAYVFKAIPPGTYSMKVMAPGFKSVLVSDLSALVDTPTVMDVELEVGAVSETVTATVGAEAAINTSDATIGNSFEPKRLTELPLNANNVLGLLALQPGVSHPGYINGGRADQSNVTLDGVDDSIHIPNFLKWMRFQIALKRVAIHDDYRVDIRTADGRPVTSDSWIEPITPNQTVIDTPALSTSELPSGQYVLLLMGKEPDGSFVRVAEYSFKVIRY